MQGDVSDALAAVAALAALTIHMVEALLPCFTTIKQVPYLPKTHLKCVCV